MKKRDKRRRIYQTKNLYVYATGKASFGIDGVINGKRIRQRARTIEEAQLKCHDHEEGQRESNIVRTYLSAEQVRAAEQAFELLGKEGGIVQAASSFKISSKLKQTTIKDAVWRYLDSKENCSRNTYNQAKVLLMKFVDWADGRTLSAVSVEEAQVYLNTARIGSYNHYLRFTKSLYRWAISEEIAEFNPFANICPRRAEHKEVSVLSVQEAEALLEAASALYSGELLAYVAITLFAGLRPDSEMRKLSWDAINLEDAEIRVTQGKTRIPRTVEMPENLVGWLKICDRSRAIYPKNFRRKWAAVRKRAGFKGGVATSQKQRDSEAGLKPWVKDYARHSAISYRVRQTGDIFRTATWAGNSPGIIRRHYLGLVSASDAKAFWRILPC